MSCTTGKWLIQAGARVFGAVVAVGITVAIAISATVVAALTWHDRQWAATLRIGARFGASSQRTVDGIVRGVAVAAASMWFLAFAAFSAVTFGSPRVVLPQPSPVRPSHPAPWHWLPGVGFAAYFISLIVLLAIVAVNRPRRLVVPYLRDEPGSFTLWRDNRRRMRGAN